MDPALSPKGDFLAYAYCTGTSMVAFSCDPYLLELAPDVMPKSQPRRVTENGSGILGIAWTTDGRALICALGGASSRLWRVPISGGKAERLEFESELAASPAVSRVGNRLAYTHSNADQDLWKFHAGGQPETVGSSTLWERDAQFSPDGEKIAFGSARSGVPEIWVSNEDGTNPVRLTQGTGALQGTPRWSPDGHWIAFDAQGKDGHWDVYVIDAAGGQPRRLTPFPEDDFQPSWSRNGNWVYFQSAHSGRAEVWRTPAAGGQSEQMTHDGGGSPWESWDGKVLYYTKGRELFAAPLAGGAEKRILPSMYGWDYYPVENGIFYVDLPDEKHPYAFELRFLDLVTGSTTVLNKFESGGGQGLSVSPDRKTFLYSGGTVGGTDLVLIENFR